MTNKRTYLAIAVVCTTALCVQFASLKAASAASFHLAGPATSNLIKNGQFDMVPSADCDCAELIYSPAYYKAWDLAVKSIPGWTVGELPGATYGALSSPPGTGGGVSVEGGVAVTAPTGTTQSIYLYNAGPGVIWQTVKTVPGRTYTLSWYGAGYPQGTPMAKVLLVWWNDKLVRAHSYNNAGHTLENPGYALQEVKVTATSAKSVVAFGDGTKPVTIGTNFHFPAPLIGEVTLT